MTKVGVFLGATPGSGGMFQYSLAVLEGLSQLPRDEYTVAVAFFDPTWQPYLEPLGLVPVSLGTNSGRTPLTLGSFWQFLCLPLGPWKRFFWRLDPVACRLSKANCDVWLFPGQDHWSYLVPAPAIVTIHDLMHRYEPQFPEVSKWGRFFLREYRFRNITRYSLAVLVDSEVGRQHVMESYGLDPGRVFPLPYLPPSYVCSADTQEGFDTRYALPPRFLFYPAQFWAHKNHERLLQAVALLGRDCPDIFLVLAGPRRYKYRKLVGLVDELGLQERVLFTGYVPDLDLPEFYRRATALVMPTFFGPTNIPPLEAFVSGCPVAISNIYGIPDQVADAALLFDPNSVTDIAEAIRKIWMNEEIRKQLAIRGRKRAELWGQQEFNDLLRTILRSVLANR